LRVRADGFGGPAVPSLYQRHHGQAEGHHSHHSRLPRRRGFDASLHLRCQAELDLLVRSRHRMGDGSQLHRLRPARQRDHRHHLRGHSRLPRQGPLVEDRRALQAGHPLHGADHDTHTHEVGPRVRPEIRPQLAKGPRHSRRADQPRGLGLVSRARRREPHTGGRHLVADRDRDDSHHTTARHHDAEARFGDAAFSHGRRGCLQQRGGNCAARRRRVPRHPQAVARHAARDLRRPRALPADVLEPLEGHLLRRRRPPTSCSRLSFLRRAPGRSCAACSATCQRTGRWATRPPSPIRRSWQSLRGAAKRKLRKKSRKSRIPSVTAESAIAEPPAVMTAVAPRRRRAKLPLLNLVGAAIVSAAVLYVSFFPVAGLPALGAAFNPTPGAWTMAADAQVSDRMLHLSGLQQPVRVVLEKDGTAHVTARTDHDLFVATGYVHAKFRFFQMDLLRRQGAGRLSEIVGKVALDTDRFELQLGLLRTAQLEWAQLPASDPLRDALLAYAQGVNDRISEAKSTHQLDAMFTLPGYEPQPWTPIDSLLVKGDMTQTLNFTDTPLVMSLLSKSLGADLASEWFPILPPNAQSPYDPGPYPKPTVAPIETMRQVTDAEAESAKALYQKLAALPQGLVATGGASNNWAVAGAKSTSGGALLAGDPHLHLTLPAIWFQLSMDSLSYHAAGVSIPGTPVVLIGHNEHIAWSLTDAQNQQTFFYVEKEDRAHPGTYSWNGGWKEYTTLSF